MNKNFLDQLISETLKEVEKEVAQNDLRLGNLRVRNGDVNQALSIGYAVKKEKMRTKKFYHTFDFNDRIVTLCLLVRETRANADLSVGYSVCHPDDTHDEELSKKISLGRAENKRSQISDFGYGIPNELAFDLGILKGFAHRFENLIKRGDVTIKGIESAERRKELGRGTTKA